MSRKHIKISYGDESGAMEESAASVRNHAAVEAVWNANPRHKSDDLATFYSINRTVEWIQKRRFNTIALQFPDEQLCDAPLIVFELKKALANRSNHEEPSTPRLVILGDTSFGACCVDAVAAEHVAADALVHYGRACLSATNTAKLPILYVFGKARVGDANDEKSVGALVRAASSSSSTSTTTTIVFYELYFHHLFSTYSIEKEEEEENVNNNSNRVAIARASPLGDVAVADVAADGDDCGCPVCQVNDALLCNLITWHELIQREAYFIAEKSNFQRTSDACWYEAEVTWRHRIRQHRRLLGRCFNLFSSPSSSSSSSSVSTIRLIWIGEEKRSLTSEALLALMLAMPDADLHIFNPLSMQTIDAPRTAARRLLNKRFALIETAKSAEVFGLLVGTLSVRNYQRAIDYCQSLLRRANRKCHVFVVGKINVPKLANFGDAVDVFVLVACAETSLIDAKEQGFFRPIISVQELAMAFDSKRHEWTGSMQFEFEQLIRSEQEEEEEEEEDGGGDDDSNPLVHHSLVTGRVVEQHRRKKGNKNNSASKSSDGTLIKRTAGGALFDTSSDPSVLRFQQRTFKGLDPHAPTAVEEATRATEGRHGIASGYDDEQRQEEDE